MNHHPELINLVKIAKILDELGIAYYVTGGFAVSIYGRPRFTADVDMVIKMLSPQVSDMAARLKKIFPNGYVDENQINDALMQQGEFNVIDPESGLKVDFFISKDNEFEKECFQATLEKDFGYPVKFISPENLILSKLIWFKESLSTRQLEDIASVLEVQEKIDQKYLQTWIKKLDLEAEWQKLKELKN